MSARNTLTNSNNVYTCEPVAKVLNFQVLTNMSNLPTLFGHFFTGLINIMAIFAIN